MMVLGKIHCFLVGAAQHAMDFRYWIELDIGYRIGYQISDWISDIEHWIAGLDIVGTAVGVVLDIQPVGISHLASEKRH